MSNGDSASEKQRVLEELFDASELRRVKLGGGWDVAGEAGEAGECGDGGDDGGGERGGEEAHSEAVLREYVRG